MRPVYSFVVLAHAYALTVFGRSDGLAESLLSAYADTVTPMPRVKVDNRFWREVCRLVQEVVEPPVQCPPGSEEEVVKSVFAVVGPVRLAAGLLAALVRRRMVSGRGSPETKTVLRLLPHMIDRGFPLAGSMYAAAAVLQQGGFGGEGGVSPGYRVAARFSANTVIAVYRVSVAESAALLLPPGQVLDICGFPEPWTGRDYTVQRVQRALEAAGIARSLGRCRSEVAAVAGARDVVGRAGFRAYASVAVYSRVRGLGPVAWAVTVNLLHTVPSRSELEDPHSLASGLHGHPVVAAAEKAGSSTLARLIEAVRGLVEMLDRAGALIRAGDLYAPITLAQTALALGAWREARELVLNLFAGKPVSTVHLVKDLLEQGGLGEGYGLLLRLGLLVPASRGRLVSPLAAGYTTLSVTEPGSPLLARALLAVAWRVAGSGVDTLAEAVKGLGAGRVEVCPGDAAGLHAAALLSALLGTRLVEHSGCLVLENPDSDRFSLLKPHLELLVLHRGEPDPTRLRALAKDLDPEGMLEEARKRVRETVARSREA